MFCAKPLMGDIPSARVDDKSKAMTVCESSPMTYIIVSKDSISGLDVLTADSEGVPSGLSTACRGPVPGGHCSQPQISRSVLLRCNIQTRSAPRSGA